MAIKTNKYKISTEKRGQYSYTWDDVEGSLKLICSGFGKNQSSVLEKF